MGRAKANGLELEYETFGDPNDPPMVLIMGLGAQLIDWPVPFCEMLAGEGFHVIRFDNRDAGLSTSLDHLGVPQAGAPYLLSDLADDTVGLLDALGIDRAHLVGASLGGMVAQQTVIDHPDRVRSLASIMSTTGDHSVGQATPAARSVLGRPPAASRDEAIANTVRSSRIVGSTGFPGTDQELLDRAAAKYDRSYRPVGTLRQLAAALASPDRTNGLRAVTVPTVVIHGEVDPLIDVTGGRATAAAVTGAELLVIPGMGHDLPVGARPQIVEAIARNARRA